MSTPQTSKAVALDTNGAELFMGDLVAFGEKEVKGTVLGLADDGRLLVEVLERQLGHYGERTWTMRFMIPSAITHKLSECLEKPAEEKNAT